MNNGHYFAYVKQRHVGPQWHLTHRMPPLHKEYASGWLVYQDTLENHFQHVSVVPRHNNCPKKKKPIYHLATPQCLAPNLYGSSHCCTNECLLWPLSTVGKKMSQQWLRCYLGDFSDFNAPWKVSGCMSTVWTTNRSCPPTYDVRASYSVSSLLQFPPGKGQLNTPSSNFHSDQWLRCDCFHGTDNAL